MRVTRKHRRESARPLVEELEPRVLYSADLNPALAGSDALATAEVRWVDDEQSSATATPQSTTQTPRRSQEVLFVDAAVADAQALLDQIAGADGERSIDVVYLDTTLDGLAQINAALAGRSGVDAVHILSHGASAQLQLGSTTLDAATLEARADELARWAAALAEQADVLLYGCDVAQGDEGARFVARLGELTGADVAASDDRTGNTSLGGDWNLEVQAGAVQAQVLWQGTAPMGWQGVLATYTVTSTADTGAAGTLRWAINQANANAGADLINFNISGAGVHTINVLSALPTITGAVTIDGWSEPDYAGTPVIELNGGNLGTGVKGLTLGAGSSGSTVKGLIINRFTGTGIEISGSNNHTIQGNWIGLDNIGTAAAANGGKGIYALNATGLLIGTNADGSNDAAERNVVSGNNEQNIYFDNVDNSTIAGNYVGTNAAGTGDVNGSVANTARSGVFLTNGSSGNTIGGTTAAARNILSGNNHFGFEVLFGSQNNLLQGNYIGTDVTGLVALGNINGGAVFWQAGTGNVFGGNVAGARNVIAGNTYNGIVVGNASTGATIQGNYIGVGADGVTVLGNGSSGVKVEGGSTGTRIGTNADGSNDAAERNVISGNTYGVRITDSGTTGTVVAGNTIGLAADGDTIVANASYGVSVGAGATNTTIGGATAASRNVISGNASFGVYLESTTSGNSVLSNYIGTNATGTAARTNLDGVWIDGSANNTIGQAGSGNLISGNTYYGVVVDGAGATGNVIRANLIGTDAAGTGALGNGAQGILVSGGASTVSIGGTGAGQGNTIAYNAGDGVYVSAGTGVSILGNAIHTNTDQGIDLGPNGVTANDSGDADGGANNLQNFPVLTQAVTNGTQLIVAGSLNSTAGSYFRIEFFAGSAGDSSGHGEGRRYLGFANVATDGSGNASFNSALTANVAAGEVVSATATRSNATYSSFTDTSEFAANVSAVFGPGLWLSASNSATTSAGSGAVTYNDGQVVSFTDPNLALGAGTTGGTFAHVFNIDTFAGTNTNLVGLHVVGGTVVVGTTNPVTLQAGDVLLAVDSSVTLGGVSVTARDIVLFRPTTPGDYSAGTFSLLIRNPGNTGNNVRDFALVEQSMTVGGTALQAGDFLIVLSSGAYDTDIQRFRPTTMGTNPTGGSLNLFIDGDTSAGIGFGQKIRGLELIRGTTVLGGQTLQAGQILVALDGNDNVGTNNLSVTPYDVFALTVTATGNGTSSASASMILRGGNVGLSAGGEEIDALALVVSNAAPVLDSARSPVLTAQNEDSGAPVGAVGTLVSSLVDFALPAGQVDNVTDADAGALLGIAVVGADTANGVWYYSIDGGSNWSALGAVSNGNARLLAADGNTRLYFQPDANWNGTLASAITFRAWDQTSGSNGTLADTSTNGGSTAFSTATDTASLTITPVNDSPTIGGGSVPAIAEDTANPPGASISAMVGASFSDIDAGASLAGVLITHNPMNAAQGSWQYSTDGGTSWHDVGVIAYPQSLALSASTFLRFLPAAHYNGTADALSFRALDNSYAGGFTSGASKVTYDASSPGGSSPISSSLESFGANVTAVNDAPVNTVPGTQTAREGVPLVFSAANGNPISIGDVDAGGGSMQVTLAATGGTITLGATAGLTFSVGDGTADATMTFTGTLASINTALNGLSFTAPANVAGGGSLQISTSDLGNSGAGGALADTDTVAIDVAGFVITPVGGLTTTEAGGTATFSVVLRSAPSANVTVGLSSSDGTEGYASAAALTFTAANWNTPQLVTVTGADDNIVDGSVGFSIVTASASSADARYNGLDLADVSVTNADNDSASILVTPVSVSALGAETRVNTTVGDAQTLTANTSQSIASDAAGNFVVVWASNLQDGADYGIYAQRFAADGTALGAEFQVNQTTADRQTLPSVAMDAAGNFVVTWSSNNQDGSDYGVYARRYDAAGAAQGAEFRVNTTTAGSQIGSQIAMAAGGDFVVVWSSAQDPDASSGIYGQRFNAAGVAQGVEFRVNTYTAGTQQLASVAMDGVGNFVVTWASDGQDGSGNGVYGQRFDAGGVAQGAEFRVNTTTANSQLYNDVAMLADGRFVVAYQSRNADGSFEVYIQRYAANGVALGSETRVNTVTVSSEQQPIPSVTVDEGGQITVVWNSAADGDGVGVVGRRLSWTGSAIGGEFVVNTTTAGSQLYAEVVSQGGGRFVVAWDGNGPGDADGVFFQRFGMATSEAPTTATFQVGLSTQPMSDVTITIATGDASEGTVSPTTLTFTPANWNVLQTVTVFGLQDYANDGDVTYPVLTAAASSADAAYNGRDAADLVVTNREVPNVAPVNNVPGGQTVNEDATLVFSAGNGNPISVGDADAGSNALQVTLTATNGSVTLSGTTGLGFSVGDGTANATMTFTGTVANINAALAGMSFAPTANFNGAASLQIVTNDLGNTGTGGAQADIDVVAITVVAVNDAPVITSNDGGASASVSVAENTAGVTTVTSSDVDGGAPAYSIIGGADAAKFSIDPTSGALTFLSAPNFEVPTDAGGNNVYDVTVQVSDGNGGTDTQAIAVTVTNVNEAPLNTVPGAQSVNEDTALAIAGLSVNDVDGNLASVQLTVGNGTLSVSLAGGAGIGAGANGSATLTLTGTQAQINAALATLSHQGTANFNGADTLSVLSTDALGSTDSDNVAISVSAVNDAPAGTDKTVTTNEDTVYTFTAADFGFTDPNDTPAHSLLAVRIATLPAAGSLTLGGVAVTAGQSIAVADIASGLLRFTPVANANGAGYANFTFQVQDSGGTANGGVDLDPTPNTITVDVTAVNDAPVLVTNAPLTVPEEGTRTITSAYLQATDVDNAAAQLVYTVTQGPGSGSSLRLNGVTLGVGGTFTQDDINNNRVTFRFSDDAFATSFKFTLSDGVVTLPEATFSINGQPVNDAPVNTVPATFTVAEDTPTLLGGISIADIDAATGLVTTRLQVSAGVLNVTLSGATVIFAGSNGSADFTLRGTVADINASLASATYTGAPNVNGVAAASLTVTTNDGGNTGTGGALQDVDVAQIDITAVNDAPTATIVPVSYAVAEQTTLVLHGTGLSVADVDAGAATINMTLSVGSGTLTVGAGTTGVLSVSGSGTGTVMVIGTLTQLNNLLAGNLGGTVTYIHNADNPPASTTLTLSINDGGATGAGGVQSGSDTATINITPVNDAPTTGNAAGGTSEDGAYAAILLGGVDVDGTVTHFRLTSLPSNGTLYLDSSLTTVMATGTDYAAAGQQLMVYFAPNANWNGTTSFQFAAKDDQGLADATPATGTLTITPVNDAPAGTDRTVTTNEDTVYTLMVADFGFTDPSDTPAHNLLAVRIATLPAAGSLTLGGVAVTAGQSISAVDIASGLLRYTPVANANGAGYASFTFQVQDDGGTASGGADLDPTPNTITIDITPVNDAPTTGPVTLVAIAEDSGPRVITQAELLANAADIDGPSLTATGLSISSGSGTLVDNGDGTWTYTPAANDDTAVSFSYTVTDGSLTAAGTASLDITPVNDAPTGAPVVTGTPTEDQTLGVDTGSIADADGLGTFSYQWQRDGVNIGGATGSTYTLGDADVGTNIRVVVSYTDGQGTAESLTSAAAGPIANVNDAPTGAPVVTGTPTEDQTLTADTSSIADADGLGTFSYQWQRDGVDIVGATGSTYTLGDADVGTNIRVIVSYTDGRGTAESLTSAAVGPIANVNDAPTGAPVVTGTPTEDQTLTADTSSIADADGLGAFAFQWYRNGVAIGGATNATYTLGDDDVSAALTARVSYTDGWGTFESLVSAPTAPVANVNDAPTGQPVTAGAPTEDATLSADVASVADADGLGPVAYQWLRDGNLIAGATQATYTLGDADVGGRISLRIDYVDGWGTTESLTSPTSAPVQNVNDLPVGAPRVLGEATDSLTLRADASAIGDADGLGTFAYQWLRNGQAIDGATEAGYVLSARDIGAQVGVRIDYVDGHGTAESVLSAITAPVAPRGEPPPFIFEVPAAAPPSAPADPQQAAPTSQRERSADVARRPAGSAGAVADLADPASVPETRSRDADEAPTVSSRPAGSGARGDEGGAGLIDEVLPGSAPVDVSAWDDAQARANRLFNTLLRRAGVLGVEADPSDDAPADDADGGGFGLGDITPSSAVAATFTAGFIWWMTRSGGMLTMMLMGIPAWRHIDLLPVLARDLDDEEEEQRAKGLPSKRVDTAFDHLQDEGRVGALFAVDDTSHDDARSLR